LFLSFPLVLHVSYSSRRYNFQFGMRVEAMFAGLAKWLPGIVRGADSAGKAFDVEYDNGSVESRINGAFIRLVNTNGAGGSERRGSGDRDSGRGGGGSGSPSRSEGRGEAARAVSPSGNPFARQSPSTSGVLNPFARLPASPNQLPFVNPLKTPSMSPPVSQSALSPRPGVDTSPRQEFVLTNWDAVYSTTDVNASGELPSPFKSTPSMEMRSPILSGKSRAARTAPGQSRDPDNVELFPEAGLGLAKKESRRDVRTAGNAPDITKERRPAGGERERERRKGSRRAAGKVARVARAVSEHSLAGPLAGGGGDQAPSPSLRIERMGPAQVLRDARKGAGSGSNVDAARVFNSLLSISLAEDDESPPTQTLKINGKDTENMKDKTVRPKR
jgi:hypothetical protein